MELNFMDCLTLGMWFSAATAVLTAFAFEADGWVGMGWVLWGIQTNWPTGNSFAIVISNGQKCIANMKIFLSPRP